MQAASDSWRTALYTGRRALFNDSASHTLNFIISIGGKRTRRQVLPININGIGIAGDVT
jgi:hypothetical protein